MSLRVEDGNPFEGLWRGSAMEKMPYTDDFPEALLVTPEFWDGAVGQGKADRISTSVCALSNGKHQLTISDNGVGITNERRLKNWAASKSSDLLHQNGHGSKKAITKYARDYNTAVWSISWRKRGKNLQIMKAPFLGLDTEVTEIEDNEETLMPSGTQFQVEFDEDVLEKFKDQPSALADAIRELITTRYDEEILQRIEFDILVHPAEAEVPIHLNSRVGDPWHSFLWHVEQWAATGSSADIAKTWEHTEKIDGGSWTVKGFHLKMNGNYGYDLKEKHRFPFYGRKDMGRSRAHISLNGRMIEAMPIHRLLGSDVPHNRFNGMLWFINFVPDSKEDFLKMPKPSTTKVSFCETDGVMRQFKKTVLERYNEAMANAAQQAEAARMKAEQEAAAAAEAARLKAEQEASAAAPIVVPKPTVKKTKKLVVNVPPVTPDLPAPKPPVAPKERKATIPKKVKDDVWKTYIGEEIARHKCLCCKTTTIDKAGFDCGHVVSEANGGGLDVKNLRPICAGCNNSMKTMDMVEYVKKHGYFIGGGM